LASEFLAGVRCGFWIKSLDSSNHFLCSGALSIAALAVKNQGASRWPLDPKLKALRIAGCRF